MWHEQNLRERVDYFFPSSHTFARDSFGYCGQVRGFAMIILLAGLSTAAIGLLNGDKIYISLGAMGLFSSLPFVFYSGNHTT